MPLLFRCPHCGHQTWVTEEIVGQSGPCAKCQMTVTVQVNPLPGDAPPTPAAPSAPPSNRKPRISQTHTKRLLPLAGWIAASLAGVGLMALIGGLIFRQLAPPALIASATAAKQTAREQNFRQLAVALQTYHDTYGYFPPAYTADKLGRPLHSWRVLLLPFLGHRELYRQFDLDQPWDSPQNLALVNQMPDVYGCPFDADSALGETSYLAVSGSGLAFENSQHRGLAEFNDPPQDTILLVETCKTGIVWTRPKELDDQQLIWSAHAQPGGIGCEAHDGTLLVVTADGRAHRLTSTIPPERLRALATISGGESDTVDDWELEELARTPNGR